MMQSNNMRRYWFYFGILLIIIGLPFSRALISFGQAALALTFLVDRNLFIKLKELIKNKAFIAVISFYFILLLSYLWSNDSSSAISALRTKIPLLLFPLVFATEPPLSSKVYKRFMLLFISATTLSISYSFFLYFYAGLSDFREAFIFNSHIRISLEVVISIVFLVYLYNDKECGFPKYIRVLFLLISIYLIWVMLSLELLTGVLISIIIASVFIMKLIFSKSKSVVMKTTIAFSLLVIFSLVYYVADTINTYRNVESIDLTKLDSTTALGNNYINKPFEYQVENGSYIGIYIQWKEMQQAWNKRSDIDFSSKDRRNQTLKFTLLRYLNSLHLRKDAQGVNSLSASDIENIENGIANVEYVDRFSFKKRIYKLLWEWDSYKRGERILGHTIIQRLELWNASVGIINDNITLGVGIGDITKEINNILEKKNSPLFNSGLKSHNEFISALLSVGIVGFVIFLFSLFFPPFYLHKWQNPLFTYFFIILFISMLWEDTLGSMVGVTLFSFFNAIFLFGITKEKEQEK